jgi:hypothetical protein
MRISSVNRCDHIDSSNMSFEALRRTGRLRKRVWEMLFEM